MNTEDWLKLRGDQIVNQPSPADLAYAQKLLRDSVLDDEEKARVEKIIESSSLEELDRIIRGLWLNQADPISAGMNYGQKDIHRKLRNL